MTKAGPIPAEASASRALLLRSDRSVAQDGDLPRILKFFSIPCEAVTPNRHEGGDGPGAYAVISTADGLAEALRAVQAPGGALPAWVARATAVYVYGFKCDQQSTQLLRFLTGNPLASVKPIASVGTTMTTTEDLPDLCGPMSGVRTPVTLPTGGLVIDIGRTSDGCHSIVRAREGELFFSVRVAGATFYISAWHRFLDIDSTSDHYFDVKEHFCEAVPLVLFLRRVFHGAAFYAGGTNACLIVDDPPLNRRYGFLQFREALELMDRYGFATTIAFIPWNWRRGRQPTLALFKARPNQLSLAVHGCDHTAGEFAVRSPDLLRHRAQTAVQRMEHFERRTGLKADRVMVFPQGAFSPEAGRTLKLNGFVAAVNTEVAPRPDMPNRTRVADLWSVAIMRYGTFPIFTRRYAAHGIENFAFDGLLGKPCLVAAHHDIFRNHGRDLADFVGRLNSLKWNLTWRPLADVLRRSFRTRYVAEGAPEVEVYSGDLLLENPDREAREALLQKQETDADRIREVRINEEGAPFTLERGELRFRVRVPPNGTARVRIHYNNDPQLKADRVGMAAVTKVAARRYLSEFRDNYLSRSDFLYRSARRLAKALR